MRTLLIFVIVTLAVVMPVLAQYGLKLKPKTVKSVLCVNLLAFFGMLAVFTVAMWNGNNVFAAGTEAVAVTADGMKYLAAALSTGLACIGAGIAVAAAASAALGAISEDASIMGKAMILVALAEGIALYGLLISFMIIG